mgnify:FL=1
MKGFGDIGIWNQARAMLHGCALAAAVMSALPLGGCFRDEVPSSQFVSDFEMRFSYGEFGNGRPFSTPLSVLMTNTTEQFSYSLESGADGVVAVSGIMPGQYTVTVSGSLTAEEAASVGTDTDGEPLYLSGFISGLGLHLEAAPQLPETRLIAASASPVIFKELYYSGSTTPNNGSYRNDTFFSIYNNSSKPQDIGNLYIGMNEFYGGLGEAGPLWPGEEAGNYTHAYLKSVWKIVAGGKPFVMQPGQTAVIATMAAPHNKDAAYNLNSPVDLSGADFEAYVNDPENKYPDFGAANMEMSFWPDYGYLWRPSVFGQGMVLLKATPEEFASFERVTLPETFQDPFEDEEYWNCLKVPYDHVVDAVDLIQNETATGTKRFSPVLDAGFATVARTYAGLSVRRKVLSSTDGRVRLQDTNNSTADFEINEKPLSE